MSTSIWVPEDKTITELLMEPHTIRVLNLSPNRIQ